MQVPGSPDDNLGFLHPAFRPTQADLLQAASITADMQQRRMQLAGEVVPFPEPERITPEQTLKDRTSRVLGRALGKQNILPIKPEGK